MSESQTPPETEPGKVKQVAGAAKEKAESAVGNVVDHPVASVVGGALGLPLGPFGVAAGVFVGGYVGKKLSGG